MPAAKKLTDAKRSEIFRKAEALGRVSELQSQAAVLEADGWSGDDALLLAAVNVLDDAKWRHLLSREASQWLLGGPPKPQPVARPDRLLGNWDMMVWVLTHLFERDVYDAAPDLATAKLAAWVNKDSDNLREFMRQLLPKLAQGAAPQAQEMLEADARDLSNLCQQVARWAEEAELEAAAGGNGRDG